VILAVGCGDKDEFDPEPLLVPWDQLTGRIVYLRGYEDVILIDATRREVRRVYKFNQLDSMARDVTWHPSGNSVTVSLFNLAGAAWSLASVDVRTGSRSDLYSEFQEPRFASWSPDGTVAFVAYGPPSPGGLYVDGTLVSNVDVEPLNAPSWSPDGTTLAVITSNPASSVHSFADLSLLDVGTGAVTPLGPVDCSEPRYSPDGTRIAFTRFSVAPPGEELWIAGVPGASEVHLAGADSIGPAHPAWSPEGSRLAVQSNQAGTGQKLYLVDAVTGGAVQLTAKGGYAPAWIP
jgi:hypothetical protein